MEEYSSAIDNFVKNSNGTYADYADYADVLAEIENTRSTLDGLQLPAGKTFDTAVTDIISRELGKTDSELKKLEAKLQKEIDALKGMIQSLVYVPEYADGEVRFTTLFVDKDYTNGNSSNLSDWTPVVSMNEVKMKFRVSPKSAVADDGSGKYIITTDAQELKTRAANVFSVTKVTAVANEPNLIEVALNAGTAAQSYAVALTVSGKDNTTEFTDITSNYFAVIKQNRYIKKSHLPIFCIRSSTGRHHARERSVVTLHNCNIQCTESQSVCRRMYHGVRSHSSRSRNGGW